MANLMKIKGEKYVNAEDASNICAMLDSLCSTKVHQTILQDYPTDVVIIPLGDLDTHTIQEVFISGMHYIFVNVFYILN